MKSSTSYVGLDVHKSTISVAIAEDGRGGDVRDYGVVENRADILVKLVERLGRRGQLLHFCYEAGPCGYGLHRLLSGLGQDSTVVAPSLIPKKAGDRVKTNRRDAAMLARLHRAGELTAVWVPDAAHEAMRDLVRARATAARVPLVRRAGDGRANMGRNGVHRESGSSAGGDVACGFLTAILADPAVKPLLSTEHFSVVDIHGLATMPTTSVHWA